ncbi:hypothetical protein ACLK1S_10955 [Escherichia coli]
MRAIRKSRLVEVAEGSLRRATSRAARSPMKIITISAWGWWVPSGNRAFDQPPHNWMPQMPRRGSRLSGAPCQRRNSTTLWINGDWITGQGAIACEA